MLHAGIGYFEVPRFAGKQHTQREANRFDAGFDWIH
jgi:hypothetical protein